MTEIGKVYANTEREEDRADTHFIAQGWIAGDGLLGVVLEAVKDLAAAAERRGFRAGDEAYARKQGEAWLGLFAALKAIEECCDGK